MIVRTAASTSARPGFCTLSCGVLTRSSACTFGLTAMLLSADVDATLIASRRKPFGWPLGRKVPEFFRTSRDGARHRPSHLPAAPASGLLSKPLVAPLAVISEKSVLEPQRTFRTISWRDYESRFHVRMEAAIIVDGAGFLQNRGKGRFRRQRHVPVAVSRRRGVGEDVLVDPFDGVTDFCRSFRR